MSQHNIGRIFLSTPSARRATIDEYKAHKKAEISIHALREEGDREIQTDRAWRANFYPRPPRGGRPNPPVWVELISGFLSTPSARRATSQVEMARRINKDFYPRPPRGGRPMPGYCGYFSNRFLSTPSARRATLPRGGKFRHRRHFYPRPPRGGRPRTCWIFCYRWYFYPRPPRGGRHIFSKTLTGVLIFLSTPSARRATS